MRNILSILALIAAVSPQTGQTAPTFTTDQISKVGQVILAAKENGEFKEVFLNDTPVYDEETEVWAFRGGWQRTPGGKSYTFEIRESDGNYRLGWVSPDGSSPGLKRFRIHPSIRRELKRIFKEISNSPN